MIHSFKQCVKENKETGTVVQVRETMVQVTGLPGAAVGEGVSFETGEHGMVLSVYGETVEIMVLARLPISPLTKVGRTGHQLRISCGEGLLGHTLDIFGYIKDAKREKSDSPESRQIITTPSGISGRTAVKKIHEYWSRDC